MSNFVRKFSLEFCQKFLNFFRENYYSKKFPRVFLDFSRKISQKKLVQVRNLGGCIYAFIVYQLAYVSKKMQTTGVRSLSRRGHPRHALKYSSNNSVGTHILRRAAPGRR